MRVVAPPRPAGLSGVPPAQPHGFSELVHAPTRLSLLSLLSATDRIEFGLLRDALELSDSALSKQLSILEQAGLVALERDGIGRGKRVRVRMTDSGRRTFDDHVAALQAIVRRGATGTPRWSTSPG